MISGTNLKLLSRKLKAPRLYKLLLHSQTGLSIHSLLSDASLDTMGTLLWLSFCHLAAWTVYLENQSF